MSGGKGRFRILAAVALASTLGLGGCGLSAKTYSFFGSYDANRQQASQTQVLDPSQRDALASSLASNGASSTAAAAITPDISPLALSAMRDQANTEARNLLNHTDPCGPFADTTAAGATAATTCPTQ